MKRIVALLVLVAIVTFSCESKTATGALAGGAIGATVGGIAGGGQGALIGGAAGVIVGGLVGAALDEQDRKNMERESPHTLKKIDRGEQLTINDVIKMSKAGLSDQVIINQIDATGSQFELNSDEIIDLKNSGVSQRVINYMIETGNR